MSRALRVFALSVLLAVVSAVPAFAASSPWGTVDVVLSADAQQPVYIVAGTLAEGVEPPVEASLAVPSGSNVGWAGEVLGGPLEEDPDLKTTVTSGPAGDVHSFTLTQGRIAQIEALVPGSVSADGENVSAALEWTAPEDLPVVDLRVAVPAGSQLGDLPEGATLEPGPAGLQYVYKQWEGVKAGDTVGLTVAFTPPVGGAQGAAPAAPAAPATTQSSSIAPIVIVGVALVGAVLLIVAVRRRLGNQATSSSGDEFDEPSDDAVDIVEHDGVATDEDTEDETEAAATGRRRLTPATILLIVVVAVLVVGTAYGVSASRAPQVVGGTISQQIAQVDECTSASFALAIPQGTSAEDAASAIFDALRTTPGIGLATIYLDEARVEVGFCDSNSTEEIIRSTLQPTGLLAQ